MKTIQQRQEQKGKVSVKSANAKPAVGAALGFAIADAIEREGRTTLEAILQCLGKSPAIIAGAIVAVQSRRDERKAEFSDVSGMPDEAKEINRKARRSLDANYQRPITILGAMMKGTVSSDDLRACTSLIEAYSLCADSSKGGGKRTETTAPLRGSGFDSWNKKTKRILEKKDGKPTAESIARLEQHIRDCLALLAPHHLQTVLPVADMLACVAKPKSGKTKHLKAA